MRYGTTQGKTKFTYDGDDVLLDDNDGTQTKYLNGLGIDNKLRQTTGSSTSYFLSDHLGSTNGLADGSGALTASNSYDSFGNASNANFPTRYQFTGREFDNFSGLHYYRARFYDSKLGRFISEDPIGFEGGDVNLYGYVGNNPFMYTDSTGLDAEYDQQLWRAQQDLIEALAPAIEFGAGFGDTVLFGASRYIRQWQGIDSPLLDCSTSYQAGEWTAIAVQVAEAGVGIYRAGLKLAPKVRSLGNKLRYWRAGGEEKFGNNVRIAPFGNRTNNPYGRYPHYHRRGLDDAGKIIDGQGLGRHRPWERKSTDTSFWDRF